MGISAEGMSKKQREVQQVLCFLRGLYVGRYSEIQLDLHMHQGRAYIMKFVGVLQSSAKFASPRTHMLYVKPWIPIVLQTHAYVKSKHLAVKRLEVVEGTQQNFMRDRNLIAGRCTRYFDKGRSINQWKKVCPTMTGCCNIS